MVCHRRYICSSCFFFSSRRRHTRYIGDWSSDVCSSDLPSTSRPRKRPRRWWRNTAACSTWHPWIRWREIGRASCRERVEVAEGAVAFKKKTSEHVHAGVIEVATSDNVGVIEFVAHIGGS